MKRFNIDQVWCIATLFVLGGVFDVFGLDLTYSMLNCLPMILAC